MRSFDIIRSKESLCVRRKKGHTILFLLFFAIFWGLFLVVPFSNIFIYHHETTVNVVLGACLTAMFLPVFIAYGAYLSKRVVLLDKSQNSIVLNGQTIGSLTDVRRIDLGRYVVPTIRREPSAVSALYLEMADGRAVEIERATLAGPPRSDLKEVGLVIADFAQIKSNLLF